MEKYIGLDLGTTTLGISFSDSLGIVHNKENFSFERGNYKKAREHLIELAESLEIYNIVIGLPLQLDRIEGTRCKSVRRFADDCSKMNPKLKFYFSDESFTTIEARERLLASGVKEKDIKSKIDMVSSFIILEDFLRGIKNGNVK